MLPINLTTGGRKQSSSDCSNTSGESDFDTVKRPRPHHTRRERTRPVETYLAARSLTTKRALAVREADGTRRYGADPVNDAIERDGHSGQMLDAIASLPRD